MSRSAQRIAPPRPARRQPLEVPVVTGSRAARSDPRWPAIAAALEVLRMQRRHSVRIVDADCGCGTLLIEAVRHARRIGFTAIEGRGIGNSPSLVGRAQAAAARLRDPAIGLVFAREDLLQALAEEAECPADILLWHGGRGADGLPGVAEARAAAAEMLIGDLAASAGGNAAA
ncbi:SAM-dependent methyltransferase [Sphingomonas sp. PL-96]|uniref:SAM-dependent methyltransferase n=1 Tax=Sphingomonas sp. PL-96 TaxID=2887201 RepID=UPI001E64D9B5|nr:SAM-dependent methyltransferase [Sphingomonas sp. PL-96]MCC2975619.1 SAM-dependent methyltransferase [Sphingomonas sp. PL-96]